VSGDIRGGGGSLRYDGRSLALGDVKNIEPDFYPYGLGECMAHG